MKLIDRHTHEKVRALSADEKHALIDLYTKQNTSRLGLAGDIIRTSRANHQLFVCDCVPDQPASPMLTSRVTGPDQFTLVNLPGRLKHHFDCPFSYTPSDKGEGERVHSGSHFLDSLTYEEDGRLEVNSQQLSDLYRTLVTNTQLNRLFANTHLSSEEFRNRIIDSARLSPSIAKQGIGRKLRFGVTNYTDVSKELKGVKSDWLILISQIDGYDGYHLYKKGTGSTPYKIPAGKIVSYPSTSFGPMVATTVVAASKKGYVFPLATAIDSIYKPSVPVVVNADEDRVILDELLEGDKPLLKWIDNKYDDKEVSFVDVHSLPTTSPITKTRTSPRFTIGRDDVRVIVADPIKLTRAAYDEQGVLLWHRSFSHIPKIAETELSKLKSTLAGIVLSQR